MKITSLLAISLLLYCTSSTNIAASKDKQVVEAVEVVQVEEANLYYKARVDTGAKTSSIHALNIQLDSPGSPEGKAISFVLVNKKGESQKIGTYVDSVAVIRTAEGSERRYKVPLTIVWKDSRKTILVTLNDRKKMRHALLLGRNWLQGDFLVDVDKNKN